MWIPSAKERPANGLIAVLEDMVTLLQIHG
jgi:hypothetical protein